MADSHENSVRESQTLHGWTLVNNQGDILSGDEDSESSESSIEVVSLVGHEVVSHYFKKERNSEQVEVVVTEHSPSTDSASEENIFNQEAINDSERADSSSVSVDITQQIEDLQEAAQDSNILPNSQTDVSDSVHDHADLTVSQGSDNQIGMPRSADNLAKDREANIPRDDVMLHSTTAESMVPISGEIPALFGSITSSQVPAEKDIEAIASDLIFQANTEAKSVSVETTRVMDQVTDDLEMSLQDVVDGAEYGACCVELLLDREHPHQSRSLSNVAVSQQTPIPALVSLEETSLSQLEGTREDCNVIRNDSDADSDFVRLDSDTDNIDAYVGEQQRNGERVVIPLKLYRSSSSIGSSFSFMRNNAERVDQAPDEDPANITDHDRDDDTESSTEEGIDDRIESEQSEAGSLFAQNDVGDLSVFADIGDLPLVAGNVPRNYIHRPNNHLSTVLNIIVVLVAILTMGISLGIIMATDLEIEEWQNAHEFQSKRVTQLEFLLKNKTKAYELQLNKVKKLEPQLTEMKSTIRILETRVKNYKRALDILADSGSLQDDDLVKTILSGVKNYVQCKEDSSQVVTVDCHLKLLKNIRSYTASINKVTAIDTILETNPLDKTSYDERDVEISCYDINADCINADPTLPGSDDTGTKNPESLISYLSRSDSALKNDFETDSRNAKTDSRNAAVDLQTRNNNGALSHEKPDFLQPDSGAGRKDYKTPGPSFEYEGHKEEENKIPREAVRASPVTLDIRQLQQSLTREQERALHWQKLYLSERRQKERERENEEWEDEREREMAEKEREQMDQVECLRKLMSANLTTLSEHVVKWNVSLFDDFANLSMLLSGISELQQAVVDSVQRVWKKAVVLDTFKSKESGSKENIWKNAVPTREMINEYLGQLADHVKKMDLPDHEEMAEYLGKMLDNVKTGVEDIVREIYKQSDSVSKIWEHAEELIKDFHDERIADGEKSDNTELHREHLLEYLSKMLNDICQKDNTLFKSHSNKNDHDDNDDLSDDEVLFADIPRANEGKSSDYKDLNKAFSDRLHSESSHDNPNQNKEETHKHGFWSRRIGKILKKAGKTVRKLGRKVAGTWDRIKTMWLEKKPIWHKIKNIWHSKKKALLNAGDRFASTVMKACSKFSWVSTKMSTNWFETTEIDINNKCVNSVRKSWQKMILKDPCQYVGKFSYECNKDRKQLKRDLKKMYASFLNLMKIPSHSDIMKLNTNNLKANYKQFRSFQDQWKKSKLLLRTDIRWVDCKVEWLFTALTASKNGNMNVLTVDKCNIINLADNFFEGHHGIIFGPDIKCVVKNMNGYLSDEEKHPNPDHDNVNFYQNTCVSPAHDDDYDNYHEVQEDKNDDKHAKLANLRGNSELNNNDADRNETDNDNLKWQQEQPKSQSDSIKENEEPSWVFAQAANREKERQKQWENIKDGDSDHYDEIYPGDWIFEMAKDRKQQREESSKSHWLFERVSNRRDHILHKWFEDDDKEFKYPKHKDHEKRWRKSGDWFLKQAEERIKARLDEHKADWIFERAADRRKNHNYRDNTNHRRHNPRQPEHGKHFRHAYGKVVSSP